MDQDPKEKPEVTKVIEEPKKEKKETVTNVPEDRPGQTDTSQESQNNPHPLK